MMTGRFIALYVLLFCTKTVMAQNPMFKKMGDSLCYYTVEYQASKAEVPDMKLWAWYLPSCKSAQVKTEVIHPNQNYVDAYGTSGFYIDNRFYSYICKSGTTIVAFGGNAVKGKEKAWLMVSDGGYGKFKKHKELDALTEIWREERKAERPIIAAFEPGSKRFYYIAKGNLYSFAEDASDVEQPKLELAAVGGLSIVNFKLSNNGRYALLELVPTSNIAPQTRILVTSGSKVVRCFDMQTKKPIMAITPEQINHTVFSNDGRYLFYRNIWGSYYFDMQEQKQLGKYKIEIVKYGDNRWSTWYVDDRYFYIVSDDGGYNSKGLRIFDLKNNGELAHRGVLTQYR